MWLVPTQYGKHPRKSKPRGGLVGDQRSQHRFNSFSWRDIPRGGVPPPDQPLFFFTSSSFFQPQNPPHRRVLIPVHPNWTVDLLPFGGAKWGETGENRLKSGWTAQGLVNKLIFFIYIIDSSWRFFLQFRWFFFWTSFTQWVPITPKKLDTNLIFGSVA